MPFIAQKTDQLANDTAIVNADEMQMPKSEELSADKVPGQSETRIDKSIQPLTVLEEKDKKTKEDNIMPAPTPAAPIIADQESKKELEKVSPSSAAAEKADMQR